MNKELWIARDYHYTICDIRFDQITGYNSREMFLDARYIDKRPNPTCILVIDAIISTGSTIINCVKSISERYRRKVIWTGAYALISKPQYGGYKKVRDALHIPCKSVFEVFHDSENLKCIVSKEQ